MEYVNLGRTGMKVSRTLSWIADVKFVNGHGSELKPVEAGVGSE